MKRTLLIAAVLGLVAVAPAEAASFVPGKVQERAATSVHALGDQVVKAQDVGRASISGLTGICGKKRNRPYNCALTVSVTYIRQGPSGWVYTDADCSVRLYATRRTAWFPSEWFGCPAEWNPSYQYVRSQRQAASAA